jgi:hypothetical protein
MSPDASALHRAVSRQKQDTGTLAATTCESMKKHNIGIYSEKAVYQQGAGL